jgi:predicted PurR-regulated permease PerM
MTLSVTQKRAFAWATIAVVVALLLLVLGPVLTPFVVAAVLAYALTPLVDLLDNLGRGRIPRVLAVIVVELFFLIALLGVLLLMVPILTKELPQMREQLPLLLDGLSAWLKPRLAQFGVPVSLEVANIKAFALKYLNTNGEDALASVLSSLKLGGSVAMAVLSNAVLIPVALFYMLMEWHRFVAQLVAFVPPRLRAAVDSFTGEADAVLGQYLRGQLLVMVTLAAFYSVALALFGLDLALPIGVFTGLAVFVPYLGFGLGLVLAALAGGLQFASIKVLVMLAVVFGTGQVLEGFVLTPRLVGERIGLHPLAVIFALLAFGQVLGFVGVLIALPASAVLLVAIRRIRAGYLASPLYQG